MLRLNLTHELCPDQNWVDLQFNKHEPQSKLLERVMRATGSDPKYIRLALYDNNSNFVGLVTEGLGAIDVSSGFRLHVYDDDENSVLRKLNEKNEEPVRFELSEEKYLQRKGNAREWLQKMREQRKSMNGNVAGSAAQPESPREIAKRLWGEEGALHFRCRVKNSNIAGVCCWVGYPSEALQASLGLQAATCYAGVAVEDPALGVFDGMDGARTLVPLKGDLATHGALLVPCALVEKLDDQVAEPPGSKFDQF